MIGQNLVDDTELYARLDAKHLAMLVYDKVIIGGQFIPKFVINQWVDIRYKEHKEMFLNVFWKTLKELDT